MNTTLMTELMIDTLFYRQTNPDASCLQTNLAGHELEQQSADALPVIEGVLRDIVSPTLSASEDHPYLGLSNLLGAYMLIGSNHDVSRAVSFLRTLPPVLQAKAVALVPVFFRKAMVRPQEKAVNDLKELPDERLLFFVKQASQSENRVLRKNAEWAMSFFPL